MATSGTTAFDLDFTDIAEEAWERAGKEMRTGYDLKTARRSMNLMMLEWQNRGLNLWTVDQQTQALTAGTATYTLDASTVAVLEAVIRTDAGDVTKQTDVNLNRIPVSTYATIPNKLTQGRPIQFYFDRQVTPQVTVWPVPDNSTYSMVYWRLRRIEDAGDGVENPDMPTRFYPALVSGLAYHLAMKSPDLRGGAEMLKMDYEEQFRLAAEEDRDRSDVRIVPRMAGYR